MRQDHLLSSFFKYTSANIMGMIGISCYILADTFFVSAGLGTKGLTALNLAIPVFNFINGSGLMIGIGGATAFSIAKAKKNSKEGNQIFSCSLILTLLFALLFVFLGLFGSSFLATRLGANEEVFAMTQTYLRVLLLFSPAFILNNVFLAFVRNDGNPKLSMAGMLIGSFSNIILDYILVFPLKMGIFGAAFATGLSPIISMLILSTHLLKKKNTFHLEKDFNSIKKAFFTLSLGASSFVTELASGIVMIVFNMVILSLAGNIGVAAYGIIANLSLVVTSIFVGISQGIQPLLSDAYGRKNKVHIRKICQYALIMSLILAAASYVLLVVFKTPIVNIFNKENNLELATIAKKGITWYFTAFFFAGTNIVLISILNSITKAKQAFILSILRGALLILPITLGLSYLFHLTGVWLSFPITEIITLVIGFVFSFSSSTDLV